MLVRVARRVRSKSHGDREPQGVMGNDRGCWLKHGIGWAVGRGRCQILVETRSTV